ncbi:hypothetical protein ACHHV8_33845 [Paenibacillus sp. TAB 01]|uniref:hypothetical protein n=1 Tax=Paenibacillus sp. TAB 01 TaxID=3368988 RepID=UPI00375233A1
MKLVLASDFILDKDPAAGSPDNEEFNLIARHYLDAFDQMILCSPVPPYHRLRRIQPFKFGIGGWYLSLCLL